MAEDQEKAIARERMDKRIAMFLVGPVGLYFGYQFMPTMDGRAPYDFTERVICLTIGAVTAFAAANVYFKVMQGRYIFGKKKD